MVREQSGVYETEAKRIIGFGFVSILASPENIKLGFIFIQHFEPPIIQYVILKRVPKGSCLIRSKLKGSGFGVDVCQEAWFYVSNYMSRRRRVQWLQRFQYFES